MLDPVFDIFREEAREHLGALERGFLDLEAAAADARRSLIDNLFRHAHSLKGDARAIGLQTLQQTSQVLEDILDGLRGAPEKTDRGRIDQGLAQLDLVRGAYEAWQGGQETENDDQRQTEEPPTSKPAGEAPVVVAEAPVVVAEETPAFASPPAEPTAPAPPPVAKGATQPAEQVSTASAPRDETFTVRVPSERLDRMLNLAGEIRISQRVADSVQDRLTVLHAYLEQIPGAGQRRSRATDHDLQQHRLAIATWQSQMSDQLRRIESELGKKATREELLVEALEADIRQARLLPLVMLTDSLRRSVRDLALSLGKSIRFDIDVGKILLDKAVIEALREPLLHLIRNAADHGLESPAERLAAGKPVEGRIRIQAARRGELVAISVSDDGRGVDYDKIRERIRRNGGTEEADLLQMSQRDLAKHLFQPGFSTAPAGDVSGRGVGLDVVMTEVLRLHGTLDLHPGAGELGAGTTFVITVPVTISTVRILTVLSGGQYYGIPTSTIIRTGNVSESSLRELEGSLVLPVDGQPVRWVSLSDLLGTTGMHPANNGARSPYLLVGYEGRQVAVVVDDLEDESEVLLKPLGFPLSGLAGVVGGAVRPDGSVQVVLDVIAIAFGKMEHRASRPAARPKAVGRIMVVDDSPTTRSILRNVLSAAGYLVRTASDGVDALERLRTQLVDLVISDVEMPRMNGFDLTRQIKAKLRLPVILVTGKEKEEHRREGLEAGADAYVVKSSFEGEGLLQVVSQFM